MDGAQRKKGVARRRLAKNTWLTKITNTLTYTNIAYTLPSQYTITIHVTPTHIYTVVAYSEMKRRESHSASSKVSSSKGSSQPAIGYEPVPQHPASKSSEEKERDGGQGWT